MSNQKGFVNIILVVVVVALVGMVGYLGFVRKDCKEISPPKMGQQDSRIVQVGEKVYFCQTFFDGLRVKKLEPAVQQTPTPGGETTNLKTETNTQYNFEFKYPTDWIVTDAIKPTTGSQLLILPLKKKGAVDAEIPVIYVEVAAKNSYLAEKHPTSKTVSVAGEIGIETASEDPLAGHKIISTLLSHNDLQYLIATRWSSSDQKSQSVIDAYKVVLSTFKFTK
ncbi:MAG: hypothetical protein HYX21_02750 [Candidatus Yanofskybacteria bacterium]|nr:hypothetical protein [Candidatus Yanofskybacteria bacterium]